MITTRINLPAALSTAAAAVVLLASAAMADGSRAPGDPSAGRDVGARAETAAPAEGRPTAKPRAAISGPDRVADPSNAFGSDLFDATGAGSWAEQIRRGLVGETGGRA